MSTNIGSDGVPDAFAGTGTATVAPAGASLPRGEIGLLGVLMPGLAQVAPAFNLFFTTGLMAAFAGASVPLVFLISMVGLIATAASLALFSGVFPSAGSFLTYIARSMGIRTSVVVGVITLLGYIIAFGGIYIFVGQYIVLNVLNDPHIWGITQIVTIAYGALVVAPVVIGLKFGVRTTVVLYVFEVVLLLALAITVLAKGGASGLSATPFHWPGGSGTKDIFIAFSLAVLAFGGFEAAAPLAEEAREPRKTVPRAVLLACLIIGIFYLFTTVAADAYVGPANLQSFGGLGGGSPWILFARQLWGWGWVIVFLAVVNSFFANGNSALVASTRTWYAMSRIRLLPAAFERTSARHASPVVGIAAQTSLTLLIALPLALGYGPATAFQLLATILTAVMLGIYFVINLSSIGYYWRKQRDEFNWFLHLVLPAAGALILVPVLAAAVGVGSSVLKFVSPLPYPINEVGLAVGIWYVIGVGYLIYLLRTHPDRIRDMDKVFD